MVPFEFIGKFTGSRAVIKTSNIQNSLALHQRRPKIGCDAPANVHFKKCIIPVFMKEMVYSFAGTMRESVAS